MFVYSWVSPCLPEDVTFYSQNGEKWFYSLSHEEEAGFLSDKISTKEIKNALPAMKIGKE